MTKSIIILIFALSLQFCYSQSVFYPGYIITNENDTTLGLIENNSFSKNADYCVFKKTETSEILKYTPAEIKAYRFIDGKYYSSELLYEKPIFLEYLVKGNLNLFFNRDNDGENYFYVSKSNMPLMELYVSKRVIDVEYESAYVTTNTFSKDTSQFWSENVGDLSFKSKKFVGILRYYTDNHPKLIDDINNAELTHQSLLKIVNKYNSLTDQTVKEKAYSKKFKRNIIVQAGGGLAMLFFKKDDSDISFRNLLVAGQVDHNVEVEALFTPVYSAQILFQQSERSENLYFGIGFFNYVNLNNADPFYRIPISINYINQKMGLSPLFSYQLDLNRFGMCQMAEVGLKYQIKKLSLNFTAGALTKGFIFIYGANSQLRIGYQF